MTLILDNYTGTHGITIQISKNDTLIFTNTVNSLNKDQDILNNNFRFGSYDTNPVLFKMLIYSTNYANDLHIAIHFLKTSAKFRRAFINMEHKNAKLC